MICRNHPEVMEGVRACSRCGDTYCSHCLVTIGNLPYCAACKTEQLLDVRSGLGLSLRYASVMKRLGALFLDRIIELAIWWMTFAAVMYGSGIMSGRNPDPRPIFWLTVLPIFAIPLLYEGLMLSLNDGRTVGKIALRIRVVRSDGTSISAAQAWVRAVMSLAFGCLIIVDYVPAWFTEEKITFHDLIAGTRVVDLSENV